MDNEAVVLADDIKIEYTVPVEVVVYNLLTGKTVTTKAEMLQVMYGDKNDRTKTA